ERYAGWSGALGRSILTGDAALELLSVPVLAGDIDPQPVSGRQEMLENIVNRAIWAVDRAEAADSAPIATAGRS
ncbi:MAG TPA: hypothetical protein VIM24_05700, partial [Candidatus Limnocylindrales bacterium]